MFRKLVLALTGLAAMGVAANFVLTIPLLRRSQKHEVFPQNYGIMNLQNQELCDSTRAISASSGGTSWETRYRSA
jgi:hypothetical protein